MAIQPRFRVYDYFHIYWSNFKILFYACVVEGYKTRVIPNNVCIVISTQFNLNCIFRIDLIHLQQKSLQETLKQLRVQEF